MSTTYTDVMSAGAKLDGAAALTSRYNHNFQGGVKVDGSGVPVSYGYQWLDTQVVNIARVKIHVIPLSSFMSDHMCQGY